MLLHRTRATMAAFVTSLQAYVMTEVLEAEWAAFAQQLDFTPNMDDLVGEPGSTTMYVGMTVSACLPPTLQRTSRGCM